MIKFVLVGLCFGFIHFGKKGSKDEIQPFEKCEGVGDSYGLEEIGTNPKFAHPGQSFKIQISGTMQETVANPVCKMSLPQFPGQKIPVKSMCSFQDCPILKNTEWKVTRTIDVPMKASALLGKTIDVKVECQDSLIPITEENAFWDDSIDANICVTTQVKLAIFRLTESSPDESHQQSTDSSPLIFSLFSAGIIGFLVGVFVSLFIILVMSRRKHHSDTDIWNAAHASIYLDDNYVDHDSIVDTK